jgi:hypothetical protein
MTHDDDERTENVGVVIEDGRERARVEAAGCDGLSGPRGRRRVVDVHRRRVLGVAIHNVDGVGELQGMKSDKNIDRAICNTLGRGSMTCWHHRRVYYFRQYTHPQVKRGGKRRVPLRTVDQKR